MRYLNMNRHMKTFERRKQIARRLLSDGKVWTLPELSEAMIREGEEGTPNGIKNSVRNVVTSLHRDNEIEVVESTYEVPSPNGGRPHKRARPGFRAKYV